MILFNLTLFRNRMGPSGGLGGGQPLNFMRNTFGGGSNQGEHLSLPSVAGATLSKIGTNNAIGSHLLGQENHSENVKGQGMLKWNKAQNTCTM